MPMPRSLLAALVVLALCGLGTARVPSESHLTPAMSYLPRFTARGGAPDAALLAHDPARSPHDTYRSTGPGIRYADRFRAGSVTKSFVAAVVLQLAGEGRLRLTDPVERFLPGLVRGHGNDGRRITLRALLDHTSGLYDYTDDVTARPLSALAAVRTATAHRPAAAPGTYAYSNTDYALLGLVVGRVTGHDYATEIRRLIDPLRLTGTSLPGSRTTLPAPHGRAYSRTGDGRLTDVTELDPRIAGAAGELISTLFDLNRFYAALLGGRLLKPAQLAALLDTTATHGVYGLGVYPERLSCGVTVWGHNGRIAGSYVRTAATRDGRHTLTFRVDTDTLTGADVLESGLLEAEFCPR
ncbi:MULTISPECIES: serine hydrolase domain-containing protein [unclassified Streptomyces]|uniref:serine hydrolase domain-containing protein n=1 Tax=unclassified Streptomyces TaxID=2593676 RepID=UPI000DAB590A|nr:MULTISPECIES: serine hydrolase domain-containing protein [unclassified Streptomyces]PZT76187.1 serine hydrolase [Streptomyces sp. AC1-42W]PZT79860.1 serine hydrolase [Streptomyces sp. AC1-42T]